MTEKVYKAMCLVFLAALVVFGALNLPHGAQVTRPRINVISVSTFSEYSGDVWIVDYAIDGAAYSVRLPITRDPTGYIEYLSRIGDMED